MHWQGSVVLLQCIMKWYYENEIIFFVTIMSLSLLNEVGIVAFQLPMIQEGPIKICSYSNC